LRDRPVSQIYANTFRNEGKGPNKSSVQDLTPKLSGKLVQSKTRKKRKKKKTGSKKKPISITTTSHT